MFSVEDSELDVPEFALLFELLEKLELFELPEKLELFELPEKLEFLFVPLFVSQQLK